MLTDYIYCCGIRFVTMSQVSRLHPNVKSSGLTQTFVLGGLESNHNFTTVEILSPHKDTDSCPDRDPLVA